MPENTTNTNTNTAAAENNNQQTQANTAAQQNAAAEAAGNAGNTSAAGNERTFTQAELDSIVEARLSRERKNQPDKEELEAFRTWKSSQQTEAEKNAAAIKKAQDAQAKAEQQAADALAGIAAVKKGVKPDAVDDVVALAKLKVNDNTTLEQAIDQIVAKYPHFGAAQEQKSATTGANTSNNGDTSKGDATLRAAMGLPPEENKKG